MNSISKLFLFSALCVISYSSISSDYFLPRDQYGAINLVLPQSLLSVKESNISGNGHYEPLALSPPQDVLRKISRPIGRLDILYEKGTSTCTASIVSENYILTNYHCVPGNRKNGDVEEVSILMGYYSQVETLRTKRYKVRASPITSDEELDFALLKVEGNPSNEWGIVKLLDRDPFPGESLLLVHHPLGLPLHVTRGRCRAARPNSFDSTDIFHTCDTEGGSSGSPILTTDGQHMLGIHFSGVFGNSGFNRGKRLAAISAKYNEIKELINKHSIKTPLVINNNPPAIKNRQRDFIVKINVKHKDAEVFLKSSYRTIGEMDSAGCESINSIALEKGKKKCLEQQGSFKSIDYKSCKYSGRSVRRYISNASVTCLK